MSGGAPGQCTEVFHNKFYHNVDGTRPCEKNGKMTDCVMMVEYDRDRQQMIEMYEMHNIMVQKWTILVR